ncbi:MAG: hypothetical protein KDK36_18745 [Leptospiraceae bacterium]|nr:hypothetical protein [Leptospiraceae bacterium]
MKFLSLILLVFAFTNCAIINEYIECEKNRDKMYPSAVSNCTQSQKEMDGKIDPNDPSTMRPRR